ncbi:MAG: RNA-binding cell elongation regulator Jag/EloR [Acidimicrobiales bacterium]
MEWVEAVGKTLAEAKQRALHGLGVAESDAEFQVLAEPKPGLFGRWRGEARVRARVRPARPRAREESRDRRRRRGGGERVAQTEHRRAGPEVSAGTESQEGPHGPPVRSGNGRRREPAAPRGVSAAHLPEPAGASMAVEPDEEEVVNQEEALSETPLAEQGDVARDFVVGLLECMGVDAHIEVAELDSDTVEIGVAGSDLGFLVGPRGATLAALQDLTRTVVQRRTGARHGRVLVDVAGYRSRRRQALEAFTRQVADQVAASGDERALEPMVPPDRKVVHDTANKVAGVATRSEGEEPNRRVVIFRDGEG